MTDTLIIETKSLRKQYGPVEAVRGLDLAVPANSIYGFLGRNGAGKTTTIKMLLGMTHPTGGYARVFGQDAAAVDAGVRIRQRTAFVSEDKELYNYMTAEDMIRFTASFYPQWRGDLERRYLRSFDLPPGRKIKALSRGMRTKLSLLLALCRGAEVLILDEPTSGLDPVVTEEVLQALISHVASEQMTVFFSSHQISEVEQIADRVAIMDHGRAAVQGAMDDLRERYRRIQLVFDTDAPQPDFRAPGVVRTQRKGRVLTVLASAGAEPVLEEARALKPASVDVMPVSLKEIFLETVNREV